MSQGVRVPPQCGYIMIIGLHLLIFIMFVGQARLCILMNKPRSGLWVGSERERASERASERL